MNHTSLPKAPSYLVADTLATSRTELDRIEVNGYGDVMHLKEQLPAELEDICSLRDFGGCYLVHGRYLLYATIKLKLAYASMIDTNVLPEFVAAVEASKEVVADTEFESVQADFREPSTYVGLRETDAALLYEVILHQENYVDVLRNVASKTGKYICIAQPCLRENFFNLPAGAVMLQFYDEPLKDLLRLDSFWPKEPQVERFTTAYWMWGHTTSHLVAIMNGLGWKLQRGLIVDNVCGPAWEYPLLVFARR